MEKKNKKKNYNTFQNKMVKDGPFVCVWVLINIVPQNYN